MAQETTNYNLHKYEDSDVADLKMLSPTMEIIDSTMKSNSEKSNAALPADNYTATDIMSKLTALGSPVPGLDADTIDGIEGSEILLKDALVRVENGKLEYYDGTEWKSVSKEYNNLFPIIFDSSTNISGTYYTIKELFGTEGIIKELRGYSSFYNLKLHFRITTDTNSSFILDLEDVDGVTTLASPKDAGANFLMFPNVDITFENYLKIELMQDSGSANKIISALGTYQTKE